jgi:hypothetical protein
MRPSHFHGPFAAETLYIYTKGQKHKSTKARRSRYRTSESVGIVRSRLHGCILETAGFSMPPMIEYQGLLLRNSRYIDQQGAAIQEQVISPFNTRLANPSTCG